MTAFPATHASTIGRPAARVVILVYRGVTLLDVTGPAQVFCTARVLAPEAANYEIVLASRSPSPVVTDAGVALITASLRQASARPIDTLLVAGGLGVFRACEDAALVRWIRAQGARSRRAGSTCMGAFLAAEAGLARGARVATHWRWCDELRRRHPDLDVDADAVFVNRGRLWSSAGVTAGIDMALAMVEADHGPDLALNVARSLVVYLKRPGGQSQFSVALADQIADRDGRFEALHRWIASHPRADLRVERLAERAGMSPRTFARVYAARMGVTPAKAVERIRVESARRLLEQRTMSIAEVARRCGFGSHERLRRAFARMLLTTPTTYRQRFSRS